MTTSTYLGRLRRGRGHTYLLDDERIPSVTGVLGVLDKPALIAWAARMSASYAVDHWDELTRKMISERYREIEDARYQSNRAAKEKGTRIHYLGERLGMDDEVTPPPELLGQVQAYADFLDTWQLETVATEAPVASTRSRYAGTLDLVAWSPKLGTILLDIKTGKRIYKESSLQLAGYRFCDIRMAATETVGPRGGRRVEYNDAPMFPIDAAYAAHVLGDSVNLYPVRADEFDWQAFLYARELWEWMDRATNSHRADFDPPVDEPIFPEQMPELFTRPEWLEEAA